MKILIVIKIVYIIETNNFRKPLKLYKDPKNIKIFFGINSQLHTNSILRPKTIFLVTKKTHTAMCHKNPIMKLSKYSK